MARLEVSDLRVVGSDLSVLCALARLEVSDLRVVGSDLSVLCRLARLEVSDLRALCALAHLEGSGLGL